MEVNITAIDQLRAAIAKLEKRRARTLSESARMRLSRQIGSLRSALMLHGVIE